MVVSDMTRLLTSVGMNEKAIIKTEDQVNKNMISISANLHMIGKSIEDLAAIEAKVKENLDGIKANEVKIDHTIKKISL